MKIISHDENGFPLNYDPSNYYTTSEVFIDIPQIIQTITGMDVNRYNISNYGRLYNKATKSYIPKEIIKDNNFNYIVICVKGIDDSDIFIQMHTLMGYVYLGIPIAYCPGEYIVNHIDGVKWHNELYNLEWISQSENINHADNNGLIARPFGEDNSQSELTDELYNEICRLTQEGYYPNQINTIIDCGIDITNIAQKIRSGKSETLISKNYDFSNIPRHDYSKLSNDDVVFICKELEKGTDVDDILKLMGINVYCLDREHKYLSRKRIRDIRDKKSFIEISKDYNF